MKEIYAWVPWFRELAEKIAEGVSMRMINEGMAISLCEGPNARA